jgi:fibronectin type 3 domain-containing protein
VDLSWTASQSPGVIGYNIYRGSVAGGPYSKVNSALNADTTYTDSTVTAGQTYFYVAKGVDGNDMESGASNEVQATIPNP